MVVRENEEQACTYSECQHVKCNGCMTVMMSVPVAYLRIENSLNLVLTFVGVIGDDRRLGF